MARNKDVTRKQRLGKYSLRTRWAPFWTVPKIYRKARVHPGRHTAVKRNWRRAKLKI